MLCFSPDFLLTLNGGPPPQAVINKRPLWFVLMLFLGITLVLRLAAFDIMGGLLCGLLLLLATIMVRDGMKELPKFSLVFGMLCGIDFLFYILPLLCNLIGGRSERHIEPVESVSYGDTDHLTYTLTVRTTPFFDPRASLMYNIQSAGMLSMPISMLLGAYLGISAHQDVQRHEAALFGAEDGERGIDARPNALAQGAAGPQGVVYGAAVGRLGSNSEQKYQTRGAFQGTAHKLGD